MENIMNEKSLNKLSKNQLINVLLQLNNLIKQNMPKQPIQARRNRARIKKPRTKIEQVDLIDVLDNQFKKKADHRKPVPMPRTKKPTPLPRTKIEQVDQALKGYTKSFEIGIKHNKDPLIQLQSTRKALEHHIISILASMKGLQFVETLRVTFIKTSGSEIVNKTAYFNGPAQTIINNSEVPGSLELSQQQILNKIAQWSSEGSGWTIQKVDNHYINIVKYRPMKGSSYIELPPELRNNAKGLINMKNEDNECFRWCHIRNLNPQDNHP